MSDTYRLACKTCKVVLWVGQGRPPERNNGRDNRYLYYGKVFRDFMFAHETTNEIKHELIFANSEIMANIECEIDCDFKDLTDYGEGDETKPRHTKD